MLFVAILWNIWQIVAVFIYYPPIKTHILSVNFENTCFHIHHLHSWICGGCCLQVDPCSQRSATLALSCCPVPCTSQHCTNKMHFYPNKYTHNPITLCTKSLGLASSLKLHLVKDLLYCLISKAYVIRNSCELCVSPVPEQPFSWTENSTIVCYITELPRTNNLFNNHHLTQQSSFLAHLVRRPSSDSTIQNVQEKRIVESSDDCWTNHSCEKFCGCEMYIYMYKYFLFSNVGLTLCIQMTSSDVFNSINYDVL